MDRFNYDRVALKKKAKSIVRAAKPSPILIAAIVVLLSLLINSLLSSIFLSGYNVEALQEAAANGDIKTFEHYFMEGQSHGYSAGAYILNAALNMISIVVSFGFSIFIINTVRNTEPCAGNLLDGFSMVFKVLWLYILEGIFVFLWCLLFIVPGIIALYKYRMAKYILIEHPEMRIIDCIKESKAMMKGNKGTLFELDLSFIGWYILMLFPYIGYIAQIELLPYAETSYVLFYDFISGKPVDYGFVY